MSMFWQCLVENGGIIRNRLLVLPPIGAGDTPQGPSRCELLTQWADMFVGEFEQKKGSGKAPG